MKISCLLIAAFFPTLLQAASPPQPDPKGSCAVKPFGNEYDTEIVTGKFEVLDIGKKPKPARPPFTFTLSNGQKAVLTAESRAATEEEENNISEEDARSGHCLKAAQLRSGGEVLAARLQRDYCAMASGGEIEFLEAYQQGDEAVFLQRFHYKDNHAGSVDKEWFYFSGV